MLFGIELLEQVGMIRLRERLTTYGLGAESWGSGGRSPQKLTTFRRLRHVINQYLLLVLETCGLLGETTLGTGLED